jgi:hypothetical protein
MDGEYLFLKRNFESDGCGMKWPTAPQYKPKPQALTSRRVNNRRRRVAQRLSKNVGTRPAKVILPGNVGGRMH